MAIGTEHIPRLTSIRAAPLESSPRQDQLWREVHTGNMGAGVASGGPTSYRALTLNEKAQRKLLRHVPMEFSKAAERDPVVMTLPMPGVRIRKAGTSSGSAVGPALLALTNAAKSAEAARLKEICKGRKTITLPHI